MRVSNRIHQYLQQGKSWYQRSESDISKLTVHHTAIPQNRYDTAGKLLQQIEHIHSKKGWPGLSYHYVITKDGTVYQTNAHTDITWHDSVNDDSIGIVLNGYFHEPYNERPSNKQLESLHNLIKQLREDLNLPASSVIGHRDRSQTACPGDNLYNTVQKLANEETGMSNDAAKQRDRWWNNLTGIIRNALGSDLQITETNIDDLVGSTKSEYATLQNRIEKLQDEKKKLKQSVEELSTKLDNHQKKPETNGNDGEIQVALSEINQKLNTLSENQAALSHPKTSTQSPFVLNEDTRKFIRNTVLFTGPVILLHLGSLVEAIPEGWAWGGVVLFFINVLVDLLRKLIARFKKQKETQNTDKS